MGIDVDRFTGDTYKQFVCPICIGVAQDPIITDCDHLFCKSCFSTGPCPSCRRTVGKSSPMNRILKNIYDDLKLKCTAPDCDEQLLMSNYRKHDKDCIKLIKDCQSCGYPMKMTDGQATSHDCIAYLKDQVTSLKLELERYRTQNPPGGSQDVSPNAVDIPSSRRIDFLPATTMSDELKEQLMFAIFTAEAGALTGDEKARHILKKMRTKNGGRWSVAAVPITGSFMYIRSVSGHLSVFDYDGKRWYVYKHDYCNQSNTLDRLESVPSHAPPNVKFNDENGMDSAVKEQLLFIIFTAENDGIVEQAMVDFVGRNMERIYGGHWSVWSSAKGTGGFVRESNFSALFEYGGKSWLVYKNAFL